jgi:hypothetical protein
MSGFFSFSVPNILAAVCSAACLRSVLKMVNSVSSCLKAAPLSDALASGGESPELSSSTAMRVAMMDCRRSRSPVKSCDTSAAAPLYSIMAIRSAGDMRVRTKLNIGRRKGRGLGRFRQLVDIFKIEDLGWSGACRLRQ